MVWVREDTALQYDSFEDLNEGIIGVVRGYAYTPEFWQYLNMHQNFRSTEAYRSIHDSYFGH